ncbi:MAG: hypothetical protein ACOY3I_05395 [Verrucomicrobiota bacterium]
MNAATQNSLHNSSGILKLLLSVNFFFLFSFGIISFIWPRFVELTLGLLAIFQLLLFVQLSLFAKDIEPRLPSVGYLVGQIFCWVFGALGCIYLIEQHFKFGEHTIVTLQLLNLAILGGILGSLLALLMKNKSRQVGSRMTLRSHQLIQALFAFGSIYLLYLIVSIASGSLTARWEIGNYLAPGSAAYYVRALYFLQYPFFLFLGASCRGHLLSPSNAIKILALFLCAILSGLTGGREAGVKFMIYFVFGLAYSGMNMRQIKFFGVALFFFALMFISLIGAIRKYQNFQQAEMSEKISMARNFFEENRFSRENDDASLVELFKRLAEPSGQIVIDDVVESRHYVGFKNFDRLLFLFLPRFIVPEKKAMDEGYERLVEDHRFKYNPFSSAPMTLLADSFERGGYLAVFLISLTLTFLLTLLGRLLTQIPDSCLRILIISHFTVACMRIYSFSALECVNFLTYIFLKEAIILGGILMLGRLFLPVRREESLAYSVKT